jgi:long-chain acyl-CoA synthetase
MTNLYSQLEKSFARFSAKIALNNGETIVTYGEFKELINGFAARLIAGTDYGQRVGIRGNSLISNLAAIYACFKTGRTGVFLLVEDPVSLSQIIEDAGLTRFLDEGGDLVFSKALRGLETSNQEYATWTVDPCIIIYTSGTTANLRKGVLISHNCIGECAAFMNEAMDVTEEINEVLIAPIDHLYGLARCHAVLASGGTLTFPVSSIYQALEQCNALSTVPSVLAALIETGEQRLRRIGRQVRWIQTGGMRLEVKYRSKLLEIFPNARICLHYGLTEVIRATFFDLNAHPDKIHTEGKPRPGVSLEIRNDSGLVVQPGAEGEIWISGNALAMGYTDSISWQSRIRDGWFRTSDIGVLDESGYLIYRGRSDEIVNVNGNLVHPAEVERRLSALITTPYCVVGLSDPLGQRDMVLALCVESDRPVDRGMMLAHMGIAEAHLVPKYIFSVPEFPRTTTGKIKRSELSHIVTSLVAGGGSEDKSSKLSK